MILIWLSTFDCSLNMYDLYMVYAGGKQNGIFREKPNPTEQTLYLNYSLGGDCMPNNSKVLLM